MSNSWALWRRRLIDNAQLAVTMQAKLAKEVAFMRHRSTRLRCLTSGLRQTFAPPLFGPHPAALVERWAQRNCGHCLNLYFVVSLEPYLYR